MHGEAALLLKLWFDVEERYNTTSSSTLTIHTSLWFDVEERYNTTEHYEGLSGYRCGLM